MAKALGRRPDETSDDQTETQGPEVWALGLVATLMVLAIVGLLVLAAR